MAQSLSQLYTHIVFSTKNLVLFIKPGIEAELYAYIGGTINAIGGIDYTALSGWKWNYFDILSQGALPASRQDALC